MADNDCHIDDIPHTIIDRLHQISPESSVNRLILTLTTSSRPTGLLSNVCENSNRAASWQPLQRTVQISVYNTCAYKRGCCTNWQYWMVT